MKQMAITLIHEAVDAGARRHKACAVLGISCRTLRRWHAAQDLADQRQRPTPRDYAHALTPEEKAQILTVCNSPEHQSLPPSQIVPKRADEGIYIASESSFYRVLKAQGQLNRRGRAQPPRTVPQPTAWVATGPNQVWTWDITFLPSAIRGQQTAANGIRGSYYRRSGFGSHDSLQNGYPNYRFDYQLATKHFCIVTRYQATLAFI